MNLADLLSYADIQQLGKIASEYGCDCNGHSKNDLMQSILNTIGRQACIDQFVETMDASDIHFVATLLYEDKSGYSVEELAARAKRARLLVEPDASDEMSREMIKQYKHRGWLFNGISGRNRYLMQVPEDLKRKVGKAVEARFRANVSLTDEPSAWRDEQGLLTEDLYLFLQTVDKQEITLTADGTMYKRHLLGLLESFHVKEEPVGRVSFRFGYGRRYREYPDRFSFIYDYCFYQNWLREDGGVLQLSEAGRKRLADGELEKLGQIYRLWIRLYKGPIPNVVPLVNWIIALSGQWVSVASLFAVLEPFIKPYYYDSPETVLRYRIIGMLTHLGLIQLGEHPESGAVVRATPAGLRTVKGVTIADEDMIVLPEGMC